MELVKRYLTDLQDMLCDEVVYDWGQGTVFQTKREMQKYNCGIAKAMELIDTILASDKFHSPMFNQLRNMK